MFKNSTNINPKVCNGHSLSFVNAHGPGKPKWYLSTRCHPFHFYFSVWWTFSLFWYIGYFSILTNCNRRMHVVQQYEILVFFKEIFKNIKCFFTSSLNQVCGMTNINCWLALPWLDAGLNLTTGKSLVVSKSNSFLSPSYLSSTPTTRTRLGSNSKS